MFIIYFYGPFSIAMLNNQRVNPMKSHEILLNPMKSHEIPWNPIEILLNPMKSLFFPHIFLLFSLASTQPHPQEQRPALALAPGGLRATGGHGARGAAQRGAWVAALRGEEPAGAMEKSEGHRKTIGKLWFNGI